MAVDAGLLADHRRRLPQVGQQVIGGVGDGQHVAGVELGGHVLLGAAHAQGAAGVLGADAHAVEQEAAHQVDADHVGSAGHAHRYTGGDHHQVALMDQATLLRRLHGEVHQLVGVAGIGHHQRHHAEIQGHLAAHLLIQQTGHHGGGRAEAADHLGGGAPLADGDDCVGADVGGGGTGGVGRSGGNGQAAGAGQTLHPLGVVDLAFCPLGDGIHGLHGLHRVLARGGLAGEHDGGGAVIDGVGHVGDLRPGGTGMLHHGVQHLSGGDGGLAAGHALGDHLLLQNGDLRKVDLHAHVAPGHHNAVGHGEDLGEVVDTVLILDLGNDADLGVHAVQQLADLPHVGGGADEASGYEVKALLRTEEDVLPVPLAHVGQREADTGNVDALAVFHDTVVLYPAADGGGGGVQHGQSHQTVIQQNGVSRLHILGQLGVGDGAAVLVTHDILGGQGELLPGVQHHGAVGKGLQPDLRPLGIQHGGHRQVQLFPQGLQLIQPGLVLLVRSMREVKAGHVHSGQQHFPQDALPVCGGTQSAHDLGFPHMATTSRKVIKIFMVIDFIISQKSKKEQPP